MRTVDLSGQLFNGMWSYNNLPTMATQVPEFTLRQVTSVGATGAEILHYDMSSLSGTYIETGAHMIEHTALLSDLDAAAFTHRATVCHVPRKRPRELIHRAELEAHCPQVAGGDALLIDCGWGSQWRSPSFVIDGPSYHPDCLPWLLSQKMAILGVDVPCIQAWWAPPGSPESGDAMLLELFKAEILLLAPVVNLDQVQSAHGELIALPINAEGASGAPCRAIFRES
jgi:kynurenine formamidase